MKEERNDYTEDDNIVELVDDEGNTFRLPQIPPTRGTPSRAKASDFACAHIRIPASPSDDRAASRLRTPPVFVLSCAAHPPSAPSSSVVRLTGFLL